MSLLHALLALSDPVEAAGAQGAAASHGEDPAEILMHHVVDIPGFLGLPFSKHLLFLGVVMVLVIAIVRLAMRGYQAGVPKGPLANAVEATLLFIRDDIAEKNIGHDGHKFVPLLASFFCFILAAALFGLIPFTGTSTGNLSVTLALAFISFLAQQYAGISKFGVVHHFTGLVPSGLPVWLLPIMIPVEIISMFSKPFALMVRLFANMIAGHMVITALLMLIPLMAQIATFMGLAMAPVSLGLALFIMILEVLVAFIQAYIFTLLSAIFIGMYAHPAH
ncbi:MAG: F0F1 ATP synthase subunit A [Vicinamibacteria bacterium]|jgi:F-type H+-transporting ATPase subunit a|nr:F0F1 ATP synthase subunit A [Vicinamibacteria bacterium]